MSYKRKQEKNTKIFLKRVKVEDLVPGTPYHLRKRLKIEGVVATDEVHDIVLKSVEDGFLLGELEDEKYNSSEFEIFFRY